jgi:hypothetical protein
LKLDEADLEEDLAEVDKAKKGRKRIGRSGR